MDGHDKRLRFARGGKKARSESLPAASVRPASLKSGMETVRISKEQLSALKSLAQSTVEPERAPGVGTHSLERAYRTVSAAAITSGDLWLGTRAILPFLLHFHDDLRASHRFHDTLVLFKFPRGADVPDIGEKTYRVDRLMAIERLVVRLLTKNGITEEMAARFTLSTQGGVQLHGRTCLAEYGLGSLFQHWKLLIVPKKPPKVSTDEKRSQFVRKATTSTLVTPGDSVRVPVLFVFTEQPQLAERVHRVQVVPGQAVGDALNALLQAVPSLVGLWPKDYLLPHTLDGRPIEPTAPFAQYLGASPSRNWVVLVAPPDLTRQSLVLAPTVRSSIKTQHAALLIDLDKARKDEQDAKKRAQDELQKLQARPRPDRSSLTYQAEQRALEQAKTQQQFNVDVLRTDLIRLKREMDDTVLMKEARQAAYEEHSQNVSITVHQSLVQSASDSMSDRAAGRRDRQDVEVVVRAKLANIRQQIVAVRAQAAQEQERQQQRETEYRERVAALHAQLERANAENAKMRAEVAQSEASNEAVRAQRGVIAEHVHTVQQKLAHIKLSDQALREQMQDVQRSLLMRRQQGTVPTAPPLVQSPLPSESTLPDSSVASLEVPDDTRSPTAGPHHRATPRRALPRRPSSGLPVNEAVAQDFSDTMHSLSALIESSSVAAELEAIVGDDETANALAWDDDFWDELEELILEREARFQAVLAAWEAVLDARSVLTAHVQKGGLLLARARTAQWPALSVTRDSYDMRMRASALVLEGRIVRGAEVGAVSETEILPFDEHAGVRQRGPHTRPAPPDEDSDDERAVDPLFWFGALPVPALRGAQSAYRAALDEAAHVAALQARADDLVRAYERDYGRTSETATARE